MSVLSNNLNGNLTYNIDSYHYYDQSFSKRDIPDITNKNKINIGNQEIIKDGNIYKFNSFQNQLNSIETIDSPMNEKYKNQLDYSIITMNDNNMNLEDKLLNLNNRLENVYLKIKKEKNKNDLIIHSKINMKETLIKFDKDNNIKKIRKIKNDINNLNSLFELIKKFSFEQNINENQKLNEFEEKFNKRLKNEQNIRKNTERNLSILINDKYQKLKNDIKDFSLEGCDEIKKLSIKKEQKIGELKHMIHDEKKERFNQDDEIKKKIFDKMKEYNQKMREEISLRENKDESILESIKKGLKEMKNDLYGVKKERENSQSKLVDLVNNTVAQIENSQNLRKVSSI